MIPEIDTVKLRAKTDKKPTAQAGRNRQAAKGKNVNKLPGEQ